MKLIQPRLASPPRRWQPKAEKYTLRTFLYNAFVAASLVLAGMTAEHSFNVIPPHGQVAQNSDPGTLDARKAPDAEQLNRIQADRAQSDNGITEVRNKN